MNAAQRSIYFGELWPAACQAKGWRSGDELRRRHATGECMRLVRGPQTESTSDLGPDEITALFTYLEHLAAPADVMKSARWVDCQTDYRAFNRARQADWHQAKVYGRRGGKLTRDRFGGQESAQGEPLDKFDPEAIRKRHMTMAARHRQKQRSGELGHVAQAAEQKAGQAELLDHNCPF